MLKTLEEAYRVPVDVEFAWNRGRLHILQCRPLGTSDAAERHTVPAGVPAADRVFSARRWVNDGRLPDVRYLVLIDPRDYARIDSAEERHEVARAVGRLNEALADRPFVLLGPGRWGSRDLRLGVPVTFAEICHAGALVEIARRREGYVPEPSFGTHFFQELVEAGILYLPLYPDDPDVTFNEEILLGSENALARILPSEAHLAPVVRVIDVERSFPGRRLDLVLDGEAQDALCFLR